jgi:hypothetical protein
VREEFLYVVEDIFDEMVMSLEVDDKEVALRMCKTRSSSITPFPEDSKMANLLPNVNLSSQNPICSSHIPFLIFNGRVHSYLLNFNFLLACWR